MEASGGTLMGGRGAPSSDGGTHTNVHSSSMSEEDMQSAAVRMQSAKAARAALVSKLALATAIGSPQYQQLLDQESFLKGYIQELAFSLDAAQAKGPVRRLLAAMDALRLPGKWRRTTPNFDRIFEPYPLQLEVNVPSVPDFW